MPIHDGAELIAFWQAEGVVGSRKELADSQSGLPLLPNQFQKPSFGSMEGAGLS